MSIISRTSGWPGLQATTASSSLCGVKRLFEHAQGTSSDSIKLKCTFFSCHTRPIHTSDAHIHDPVITHFTIEKKKWYFFTSYPPPRRGPRISFPPFCSLQWDADKIEKLRAQLTLLASIAWLHYIECNQYQEALVGILQKGLVADFVTILQWWLPLASIRGSYSPSFDVQQWIGLHYSPYQTHYLRHPTYHNYYPCHYFRSPYCPQGRRHTHQKERSSLELNTAWDKD
ncbi:hypothetical protein BCR41DRAFT_376017 [Lobosporangium transversale]|uniref:Uncharacterized protein n=1 Tax=Lobosporangium transversale TaxID=64571 RepID=A0A1Y2G541_9FUNG|nr:hypothetical protein BCR41DRAFT_376017 [Lobosporangium transversale]ORY93704.1 hypothetical protein BCR41DRAFT_376017 [Lobosporangium transversale]|eukprot:XP_021875199.1 hypothetical protein BCR41DRAFT_376017 [Lobosporangium transversale]